jgi:sugar phosphate isomerase/epimerase
MAMVLGAGFSGAVTEDPNFEQLKRDLERAAELRVEFVELPMFAMDLIAGERILAQQVRRLKQATEGRGIRYTVHGPLAINFMQPGDFTARHLAVAKSAIEIAAEIGAVHIVLHTGHLAGKSGAEIEAAYAAQRQAFASLGEFARERSIIIAAENIFVGSPNEYTALPSRLAREIEEIGHPNVRACLDFSHGAITCKARSANYLSEVKALAKVAKHLHIHDSFGDPAQLKTYSRSERAAYGLGDLHLPIGWGNIPWLELMGSLTFPPDVIFNLELPMHFLFALPDCVTAMREMIETYKNARAAAPS